MLILTGYQCAAETFAERLELGREHAAFGEFQQTNTLVRGARDLRDVYHSVRWIASAFLRRVADTDHPIQNNDRLRVELPRDLGTAVCVLSQHDTEPGTFVLATIIEGKQQP